MKKRFRRLQFASHSQQMCEINYPFSKRYKNSRRHPSRDTSLITYYEKKKLQCFIQKNECRKHVYLPFRRNKQTCHVGHLDWHTRSDGPTDKQFLNGNKLIIIFNLFSDIFIIYLGTIIANYNNRTFCADFFFVRYAMQQAFLIERRDLLLFTLWIAILKKKKIREKTEFVTLPFSELHREAFDNGPYASGIRTNAWRSTHDLKISNSIRSLDIGYDMGVSERRKMNCFWILFVLLLNNKCTQFWVNFCVYLIILFVYFFYFSLITRQETIRIDDYCLS